MATTQRAPRVYFLKKKNLRVQNLPVAHAETEAQQLKNWLDAAAARTRSRQPSIMAVEKVEGTAAPARDFRAKSRVAARRRSQSPLDTALASGRAS